MECLVTIVLQLEFTQESDGVLLETFGQCEEADSGVCLFSGMNKVEKAAVRNGGKPVKRKREVEKNKFYKAFLFPNREAIECFKEDLINS